MKEYYRKNKGSKKHAFSRWLFDKLTVVLKKNDCSNKEPPKKIFIICNGHIGDTVMSTSTFREIKKFYPNVEVTVLCSKLAEPILKDNPHIDKLISMNFFWRKEHRTKEAKKEYSELIKQLKDEKYDLGIALRSDLPNIFMLYKLGIKKTYGYYNLDGGKNLLTDPVLYPEKEIHATEADLNLVNKALHMFSTDNFPEIYGLIKYDRIIEGKYICICPGACAKLQTWKDSKYYRIIKWMNEKHPEYKILLCGSRSDEELIEKLSLYNNNCIKVIGRDLKQLGMLFNHSACTLLQDGGPMHIAYTMMKDADKKLIVLWGPNPLEHVAPLRGKIIHHKLNCYPCMRCEKDCKQPEWQRCMDLITIEEVKEAIEEAIK